MTNEELVLRDWATCPLCHNNLTGAITVLGGLNTLTGHLQAHEATAVNNILAAVDNLLQESGDETHCREQLREAREAHKKVQYEQGRWEGWVETTIRKNIS